LRECREVLERREGSGDCEDLVGTALFLASEGSAFLAGQVLFVDGGFSAGLAWPIDFDHQ
jgi:NAD(P)-dependent dehydrogenase (short-subunit alcohol dehydrogenase family)